MGMKDFGETERHTEMSSGCDRVQVPPSKLIFGCSVSNLLVLTLAPFASKPSAEGWWQEGGGGLEPL